MAGLHHWSAKSELFFLHTPHSDSRPVSGQTSLSCLFSHRRPFLAFSSVLLIKPGAQASIPSSYLSDHFFIHLPFIPVSQRCLLGAKRWQPGVCLALLSAFLMSLKHGGSDYYGDEEIQAGRKVSSRPHSGVSLLLSSSLLPVLFPLLTLLP